MEKNNSCENDKKSSETMRNLERIIQKQIIADLDYNLTTSQAQNSSVKGKMKISFNLSICKARLMIGSRVPDHNHKNINYFCPD